MGAVNDKLVAACRRYSRLAGGVTAAVGVCVLVGWAFDIATLKGILPGLVTMKTNTALAFLFAGVSLWLSCAAGPGKNRWHRWGGLCALVVLLVGLLTLAEHSLGWDLGIDQLLLREAPDAVGTSAPNRMAPQTALSFLLLGLALVVLGVETKSGHRPAQALALLATLGPFLAILGYGYGVSSLYGLGPHTQMALHTAPTFLLLATGVLCARPDKGWMLLACSEGMGGLVVRRLLPAAVGIPAFLGWLRLRGQQAGLYSLEFGVALSVLSTVILLALVVWWSARWLEGIDDQRRQAEQELDRFFSSSLDLLCIAGFDGCFKRVNPAWEETLGHSAAELVSRPYVDFVHPDDRPATLVEVERLSKGENVVSFENRYRARNGSHRWMLWKAAPDPGTGLIYAAARDITDRKEVEARLARLNAELEATNKELETFTYSVSHDLRAPLRHIAGFARILLDDYGQQLSADVQHCVARIQQGVEQMGLLVDDLLNLSRISRQEVRRQITGLGPLVEQTVQQLRGETRGREVEWRLEPLPFADCDPGLMKQVFANLLSNAIKFTRTRPRAVIEVGAETRNGEPVIHVRDNGVGFPMKYADKLFGVFQRLHRQEDFEGTGVGLAIVHRILAKHGGRIWAEAELDKGATFFFTLSAGEALESPAQENPTCIPAK